MHIPRGQLIRFRLAFRPREAHVTVFHGLTFSHYELRPGRILFWRAQPGVVLVDVKARAGSASYLVRLTS